MRKIVLLCVLTTALVMTSCGNEKENPQSMPKTTEKNTEKPVETAESMAEKEFISFQDIPDQFLLASGAGAWGNYITIEDDGSFAGNYHDSEMGSVGKKHPHGTVYYCDYYGQLSEPEKVNEYTYSVKIKSLKVKVKPGKKEINDKIKFIYTKPYGLEKGKALLFYSPKASMSELPEDYLSWVIPGYDSEEAIEGDEISFWGFYNPKTGAGFIDTEAD